jgi:hypothetical protein
MNQFGSIMQAALEGENHADNRADNQKHRNNEGQGAKRLPNGITDRRCR